MSLNAWLYVYSNPVTLNDPSGKYPPNPPEPMDYDETKPPAGIQFFPTTSISYARIYESWDPTKTSTPDISNWVSPGTYGSQLKIKSGWRNVCGQVSIAAILRTGDPWITANDVVYDFFEKGISGASTTGSETLAININSLYGRNWRADPTKIYWTDYFYAREHRTIQDLPNFFLSWLASGKYPIMSVEIKCGSEGKDCGRIGKTINAKHIGHWIVVTGVAQC